MDPNDVVFEIGSDEVVGWDESKGIGDIEVHVWLSVLLGEVDQEADDSDDVVFLGEVVCNPKQRFKSSFKVIDDECVILDGDPDKPVAIQNDDGVESYDLLIVSEKGQVACRDYPHSRHLCVKFPFSSTPHERHCDQCHCYACDLLAPCVYWGHGSSSSDHCHATDKEKTWRDQRKSLKNAYNGPKASDASLSMRLPQANQVPESSAPLQPIGVAQDLVSRPTAIHAHSISSNFRVPNIITQSRSQCSGFIVPRNEIQPNLVSQQLLSSRNSTNRRDRRPDNGNLHPQFPQAAFERTGSVYGSSRVAYESQYFRNPPPEVPPSNINPPRCWQDFQGGMISGSSTYLAPSQPHPCNFFDSLPNNLINGSRAKHQKNPLLIKTSLPHRGNFSSHRHAKQPDQWMSRQASQESAYKDSVTTKSFKNDRLLTDTRSKSHQEKDRKNLLMKTSLPHPGNFSSDRKQLGQWKSRQA